MPGQKFYPYLLFFIVFNQTWLTAYSQNSVPTPSPVPDEPIVGLSEKKETEKLAELSPQERHSLIHIGDIIDVDVIGSTEYDWRGKLNPEGYLDGPAAVEDPVYALCRSTEDVVKDVAKAYSRFLKEPEVRVTILDISGRANVLLYGAVRQPQRFLLKRPVYLNELIILSGGIVEKASGEVEILRSRALSCEEKQAGDESESRTINLLISELLNGKKEANPLIMPGDTITIAEAQPVYVIGGVANPKRINSRAQLTVSRAISTAGGLTRYANPRSATIFRREGAETRIISVDLEKINANPEEDILLKPYDVLEVGQTGRSGSKLPPVVKVIEDTERKNGMLPLKIVD